MIKKLFGLLIALCCAPSFATTLSPVQLLNPAGSTSGQVIVSTGASSAPGWSSVPLAGLSSIAANTVLANATASSAAPAAFSMPSCSTSTSALQYTSGTGFTCYASSATTAGTLAQFAATTSSQLAGVISDETGSGALVFATGGAINPTSTGTTTPGTGAFTTLSASGNDALLYQTTNALSVPNVTATTVTTWTKVSDRVNANFSASTGVFTAPVTGQYWVAANLTYAVTTGGSGIVQAVRIVGNSVTLMQQQIAITTTTTAPQTVSVSGLVSLAAGQTIVIQAFQNSGSAVLLAVGSAYNNSVSIVRVP